MSNIHARGSECRKNRRKRRNNNFPDTGNLWVTVENAIEKRLEKQEFDMLVLAVGATPAMDTETIRQMATIAKSPDGFLKEAHAKLRPVETPTKGVFIAGASRGDWRRS